MLIHMYTTAESWLGQSDSLVPQPNPQLLVACKTPKGREAMNWSDKGGHTWWRVYRLCDHPRARCLIKWTFPRSSSLIFLWVVWEGHAPIQTSTGHNIDMLLMSLTLSRVELSTDQHETFILWYHCWQYPSDGVGEGEVGGFTLRVNKQWLYLGLAAVRPWLAVGGPFLLYM